MANALQHALARLGENGSDDQIVSMDNAIHAAQLSRDVTKRVFIEVGSDPVRGLALVRRFQEITTAPLYVVGPREADLILDAMHAGAENFIEDADPLEQHLAKALASRKNHDKHAAGKLICLSSVRGGCGGSVIAVNLAAAFARRLERTALCDLDLHDGVCDALLNLKPKHSILDLEGCVDRMDRGSVEVALNKHSSGVHLLSSPPSAIDRHLAIGELCVRVLQALKQMFPVVVADFPRPNIDFDAEALLSMCDKLVLVTQLDFDSVRSARRMMEQLTRAGVPANRIHVVGNRNGQKNLLTADHIEQALNCKVTQLISDDSKTVNRSINCGIPFYLEATGSSLVKEFDVLADSLLDQHASISIPSEGNPRAPEPDSSNSSRMLHLLKHWLTGRKNESVTVS